MVKHLANIKHMSFKNKNEMERAIWFRLKDFWKSFYIEVKNNYNQRTEYVIYSDEHDNILFIDVLKKNGQIYIEEVW